MKVTTRNKCCHYRDRSCKQSKQERAKRQNNAILLELQKHTRTYVCMPPCAFMCLQGRGTKKWMELLLHSIQFPVLLVGRRMKERPRYLHFSTLLCPLSPCPQSHPWILDVQWGITWCPKLSLSFSIKLNVLMRGRVCEFSALTALAVPIRVSFSTSEHNLFAARETCSVLWGKELDRWRNPSCLWCFPV